MVRRQVTIRNFISTVTTSSWHTAVFIFINRTLKEGTRFCQLKSPQIFHYIYSIAQTVKTVPYSKAKPNRQKQIQVHKQRNKWKSKKRIEVVKDGELQLACKCKSVFCCWFWQMVSNKVNLLLCFAFLSVWKLQKCQRIWKAQPDRRRNLRDCV